MPNVSVIMAAAGLGLRMGGPVKKPYLELGGRPIFLRSVEKFVGLKVASASGGPPINVTEIVLVVGGAELDYVTAQWGGVISQYATPVRLVQGGGRRQDSVYCGLQSLGEDTEIVLVHDAVRPLVSSEIVKSVMKMAWEKGACVPAIPIQATVKEVDAQKRITRTINRDSLWMAQTPQGFRKEILMRAYDALAETGEEVTDDAQAVEKLGYPVEIVPGDPANIKITTPEDIRLAIALLQLVDSRQ
ncbi:MAG: 2-C-methyl-D-erythritol 4-phosphate cytidylyltransferase [Candidatus Brocadiaceae bacterium]|nr:2-C-methyl-D-erythritol 4-phosphate cytidylyltransferase [Candidatus Brocadiaceae bacterium]